MQDEVTTSQNNRLKTDAPAIKERITRILRVMAEVPALDDTALEADSPATAPLRFYQQAFE